MRPFLKRPAVARAGNWLSNYFARQKPVITAFLLITLVLYIQLVTSGRYNNFIIFRSSWQHLLASLPLYSAYPAEYFDYFLYHPSFPVLFSPFAILPERVGLLCWLAFSSALFLYALSRLPLPERTRYALAWFLLLELGNALQSSQTNPAMTAFMLLTVVHLQREEPGKAALFTCLAFFIKGYGAIVGLLFFFFPKKWEYVNYCLLYGLIGSLLPLLFVSPETLINYYTAWYNLLTSSGIKEDGSLLGSLHQITGGTFRYDQAMIIGGAVLLAGIFFTALLRRQTGGPWLMLAALMIWIVIFNQSAESPTYIIAVAGAGVALFQPPMGRWAIFLLFLTLAVTCLFPTDLVPKAINQLAVNYRVKAWPCAFVLLFIQWRLLTAATLTIPQKNPQPV